MIKSALPYLSIFCTVFSATVSTAGQRIPLSAAMAQCENQNGRYQAGAIKGNTPSSQRDQIGQQYRACVFAKSGKYPAETKRNGITISGSAQIGIVVRD